MLKIIDKKLKVVFYKTESQNEPVKDWILKLSKDDKKIIGENILTLQYTWPVGMPLVRTIEENLFEIRICLSNKQNIRVMFTLFNKTMILLHIFVKKTQKTPKKELKLTLKRKKHFIRGIL